jgi:broad specificity phosphatase PhoE
MKHIYLIRHGQSQGDVDQAIYRETPDHAIGLSDLGVEQARAAGVALRHQRRSVTQLQLDRTY